MKLPISGPGTGAPKPRGWRTAVGALTLALALGCTAPPIASGAGVLPEGAPALPAATLDVETTIPAATMRAQQTVVAGTGSYLVRHLTGPSFVHSYEYSKDQGISWQPVPAGVTSPQYLVGAGGRFLSLIEGTYSRPDDCDVWPVIGVQLWDPATGSITDLPVDLGQHFSCDQADHRILDFTGSRALIDVPGPEGDDGEVRDLVLSTGGATPLLTRFRDWPDGRSAMPALLTPNGSHAVAWHQEARSTTGYLAVAPMSTGVGGAPVTIGGLLDVDVAGSSIHTLIGTSTSLRSCVSAITSPGTRSCTTVASGDYRRLRKTSSGAQYLKGSNYRIAVVGSARLIGRYDGLGTAKLLEKGVVTSFAQGGYLSQRWLGFRDIVRPLLARVSPTRGDLVYRVATPVGLQLAFRSPLVPAEVHALSLASGLVAGIDSRGDAPESRTVWQRRLVDGVPAASAEVLRVRPGTYGYASLGASAGRVVARFDLSVYFYDLGSLKYTRSAPHFIDEVSGPYSLILGTVRRWDWAGFGSALAIFGSLAVTRTSDTTLAVRDVADPTRAPLTVSAPSGYWSGVSIRGDWVAIGSFSQEAIVVTNVRTGQTLSIPDERLVAVGDGFVLTTRAVYTLPALARFALPDHATRPTTDGVARVAWVNRDQSISVAAVAGAGTDAPRMLGVVAKSTFVATGTSKFTSAVDLDKGVNPGALEIRNSAGVLVRSLVSAGSSRGALRGSLTWDGRNSAGSLVPAGTYRLTLVATALDGSGPVTAVDGEGAATWTVKLSR